jgi:alkyl hydroperoxide reductase subunit AhpF
MLETYCVLRIPFSAIGKVGTDARITHHEIRNTHGGRSIDKEDPIMYDLVIIGGGPAGLTAAVYAIRKRLNCLLVSPDLGGKANACMHIEGVVFIMRLNTWTSPVFWSRW